MPEISSFSALAVSESLVSRLAQLHITVPTAVQSQVIPVIQSGHHVLFQSETGTGKTFAYLLPLLQNLENNPPADENVQILITAPTYELASQIKTAVQSISPVKTALFIGGSPIKRQIETLKEKPRIVIGNPARLVELIHLKKLKIQHIASAVLDEADRLITKDTVQETETLLSLLPKEVQIIACSATITEKTKQNLCGMFSSLSFVQQTDTVMLPPENILKSRITHWALYAERRDKIDALRQFLAAEKPVKALVFTSRPDQVDNIITKLTYKKVNCAGLYAKAGKMERKNAIDRFRNGKCTVLVTSDLAARGLDIPGISHIIQMDLPSDDEFFIHRAGRTARAGSTGINIVIGDEYEMEKYAALEKRLGIIVHPKQLYQGKIADPCIEQ